MTGVLFIEGIGHSSDRHMVQQIHVMSGLQEWESENLMDIGSTNVEALEQTIQKSRCHVTLSQDYSLANCF